MLPLIILALSNLASAFLTAWVIQCFTNGRSVVPSLPRKVAVENGDEMTHETETAKGRPIL